MIKYVEYDSFDETGEHIVPVNNLYQMNKTASGSYSPELMKTILSMKRRDDRYYVVINAVGSHEAWGCNKNGDSFPAEGLAHYSCRTDMGTLNDYGYKTFEYYARLFMHHVNSDPKKSFGEVVFSNWNPSLQRAELVVAINRETRADMVKSLENNEPVAVSMGCLTDGDYPILTKEGYKPIREIMVGETVMTHKGRWKKVTEVHRGEYTGELSEIHVRGLPIPLELTEEHPVLSKSFKKESLGKKRSWIKPKQFESQPFEWNNASTVESGDAIKYTGPTYSTKEFCQIGDEKLAKLMGYYTAEGSFIYNGGNPSIVQLSCCDTDDLLKEVPVIVNEMFDNVTCSIYPHNSSKKGFTVNVNSTVVAGFMYNLLGKGCRNKTVPPEIFVSKDSVKLSYLGAWLSGDGWCDKKGVHWSSASAHLLMQGRDLMMTLGIPSSIYRIVHPAGSGFSNTDTIEYTLNVSHLDAEPLVPYAADKLKRLPEIIETRLKEGNSAIRSNEDGSFSYSVREVKKRSAEKIPTYNFSVEDDESYIASGLTVHNCKVRYDRCSICNKKAKTRKQYCKHLVNHMKEIVTHDQAKQWSRETGRLIRPGMQVFAYNDHPRFFDISKVHVGADRTAFILGKAAKGGHVTHSVDIAEANGVTDEDFDKISQVIKKSEITKNVGGALGPKDIDGRVSPIKENEVLRKALDAKMNKAISSEPVLPKALLNSMSALPLKSIFSTMLGMGIMPKPAEFQRIIIVKAGREDIADELERENKIFDYRDNSAPCGCSLSNSSFADGLGKALVPHLEKRSCFVPFLKERLTKESSYSSTDGEDYWAREDSPLILDGPGNTSKILGGIAALYAGLKLKSMGYGPKNLANIFTNKPWLRTLAGGSLLWKIQESIDKSNADPSLLRPASDYEGILQDTNFSGHIKTSGLADTILLSNSYLHNAVNQEAASMRSGIIFEKTSSIKQANNSILTTQSLKQLDNEISKMSM